MRVIYSGIHPQQHRIYLFYILNSVCPPTDHVEEPVKMHVPLSFLFTMHALLIFIASMAP